MPTPVGHSLAGVAAFILGISKRYKGQFITLFLLVWLAAVLPDIDYYPLLWGDLKLANLNHQYFTHSIFFSVLSAILLSIVGKWLLKDTRAIGLFPLMLIAALSHQLMDYLTYDGRYPIGIPLLWPLDIRFNSPVSVFEGVAKGSFADIFSLHNLFVLLREALIGIFLIGLAGLYLRIKNRRKNQADST
jgi:inner membrane protein